MRNQKRKKWKLKNNLMLPSVSFIVGIFFLFLTPNYKITRYGFFTTMPTPLSLVISDKFKLKYYQNSPNCSLCNYTVRNTDANSSPYDVAIIPAVSLLQNIEVFVRTLRTTGSLCSCVVLLDNFSYHTLTPDAFREIEQCGAQIINCGETEIVEYIDAYNYCYAYTFFFIEANRHLINRVIRFDMFDTVLQGDPFNLQVDEKLNLIDEGTVMHSVPYFFDINAVWISHFDPQIKKYDGKVYKCAGYMGGTVETMYKAFGLFIEYMRLGTINNDQGAVNYFYFNNLYKKRGIEVVGSRKIELVRHCAFIPLANHHSIGDVRSLRDNETFAAVVHHYYMNPAFQFSVLKACPRKHKTMNFYISHIPEFGVVKMESFLQKCKDNCTFEHYHSQMVLEREEELKRKKEMVFEEDDDGFVIGLPPSKQ